MKTILKFDSGADGFKRMMIILGITAIFVVLIGIYFLNIIYRELQRMI